MKPLIVVSTLALTLTMSALAQDKADKVGFQDGDSIRSVLGRQAGQRVELRLKSGDKIAGKIEKVGSKTVHISSVAGQEFFDAVVEVDDISAVLIRTRER